MADKLPASISGQLIAVGGVEVGAVGTSNTDILVQSLSPEGVSEWVYTVGGPGLDIPVGVGHDPDGNVLFGGSFSQTVDFDPGAAHDAHHAPTDIYFLLNAFVTKLTADGAYLWTRSFQWDGFTDIKGLVMTVDPDGNAILGGRFGGLVDFDPGPGEAFRSSDGTGMYVVKLDGDGNFLWVATFGGGTLAGPSAMQTDADGNIAILGYFRGTVDLDPGPGVDNRTAVQTRENIFVSKLDPDGQYLGALTYVLSPSVMHVMPDGGFVLAGRFMGTVDFDGTDGTALRTAVPPAGSFSAMDIFVTKVNADWSHAWTYTVGTDEHEFADGVTVDAWGDVIVSGRFVQEKGLDFDPGPGVLWYTCEDPTPECAFILRLDSFGDVRSVFTFPMTGDYPRSVSTDPEGNVIFTRLTRIGTDADPGCEVDFHTRQTFQLVKLSCAPRTADVDSDGDVDLADLAAYQNCFEGDGATTCNPGCDMFDLTPDNAIDTTDFADLSSLFTGP